MDNYIFGIRPLLESLDSGQKPEKVLIQQGLKGDTFQQLFAKIREMKIPFQYVPSARLNKISNKNHQGVIAIMPVVEYQSLEDILPGIVESGETPLFVMLDGVTDVRNMGAIARTAECAGVHALVIPEKGGAPVNADAVKASAGALARIPVCKENNLLQAMAFLKECGIRLLALDDKGQTSLYDTKLTGPLALIMGAEDKGVSAAVRKLSDHCVSIPMKGHIASLNVSVATGIVVFEAQRQRIRQ
ncbi:MAG: 23S rRNA (guanosine(2251)-2'-O)-methyltransferase RlmB [Bacteroidales bacterium]